MTAQLCKILQDHPELFLPSGAIIMWAGAISAIPSGFVLCNGANGTPDLRDKFVKGASNNQEAGGTGGAATHTHADHAAMSHTGAAVADHAALTHAGCAVADHTLVSTKQGSSSGNVVTTKTHTVTQANQHAAQSHSVTQPAQHGAQSHAAASSEPAYYAILFLMKQ